MTVHLVLWRYRGGVKMETPPYGPPGVGPCTIGGRNTPPPLPHKRKQEGVVAPPPDMRLPMQVANNVC